MMGGDYAPKCNIEGAIAAAKQWTDISLLLVGDEAHLSAHITSMPPNVHLIHASDSIKTDDEPVKAIRRKKDASMVVAGNMVREGKADCMISAGNTGALMTIGLLIVGRMSGIDRPALAAMIPTTDQKGVLVLDLGVNMDAKPEHLVQYALMGSIYREKVHGLAKPRIGLLNVGTEMMKGNELTKQVYPLLAELPLQFIGNVEARDVLAGHCDVLVCDGFAGNVMLKSLEGTARSLFYLLKDELTRTWYKKVAAALFMPGLRSLRNMMDYKEHGGAPLLGLNKWVIKAHGSSDARAIHNAVRQARIMLQHDLLRTISVGVRERKVESE